MHKILAAYFVFTNIFFAQPKLPTLISRGLDYSYNFKLSKAEEIFKEAIKDYPDSIAGYHYLSQIYLWEFLGSKETGLLKSFHTYSDSAIKKGEQLYESNETNADLTYSLGLAYTLKATAFSFSGSSLDAFWSSKSAVKYFEETLELKPDYYDAYLGLGLFEYALSYVPGVFKWAVSLSGLSYDKAKGLDYIRLAKTKGSRDTIEAAFHLSKIYMDYVAEFDSAEIVLKELVNQYPANTLFLYQYGVLMIKARKLDEAESTLKKVLKFNHPKFIQTNSFSQFLIGDIFFKKNNFTAAIANYKTFLKTTRTVDYTGIANFRIAICYAMLGDTLKVKKHLLLARMGNTDLPDDNYAQERSEQVFENGFSGLELKLIKAENFIDNSKPGQAYNLLLSFVDTIITKDLLGKAYLLIGESLIELGEFEKAASYAKKAADINYDVEKWILPLSAYYAAEAYYKMNNFKTASIFLDFADENNDYQYQDKIEAFINNLSRKINIL